MVTGKYSLRKNRRTIHCILVQPILPGDNFKNSRQRKTFDVSYPKITSPTPGPNAFPHFRYSPLPNASKKSRSAPVRGPFAVAISRSKNSIPVCTRHIAGALNFPVNSLFGSAIHPRPQAAQRIAFSFPQFKPLRNQNSSPPDRVLPAQSPRLRPPAETSKPPRQLGEPRRKNSSLKLVPAAEGGGNCGANPRQTLLRSVQSRFPVGD